VRQFTDDVAEQLTTVSPTYASWEQAERLARVAEVVVRVPDRGLPADVHLADQVEVAERLASAQDGAGHEPGIRDLLASFDTYERDLGLLGLSDAQVAAKYAQGKLSGSLAWSMLKVALALPVAAVGVVVHVIPFQIIKQLAKRPTNEGMKATVKLLGCFALFVLTYAVLGFFAGRAFGAWVGLAVAVVAPLCGYVAVRMAERIKRIGGLVEGYRTVRGRKAVLVTVFDHRRSVIDGAQAVLAST
jgi:hypothetical protein